MWARPHLGVLPPVFVLQFSSAGLKLRGSGLQGVGPVVQFWQLLIALQNLVHVHTHDVHHLWGGDRVTQSAVRTGRLLAQVDTVEQGLQDTTHDLKFYRRLTSSTCACVCCRRRLLVRLGGPWLAPSGAGAPAAGADLTMRTTKQHKQRKSIWMSALKDRDKTVSWSLQQKTEKTLAPLNTTRVSPHCSPLHSCVLFIYFAFWSIRNAEFTVIIIILDRTLDKSGSYVSFFGLKTIRFFFLFSLALSFNLQKEKSNVVFVKVKFICYILASMGRFWRRHCAQMTTAGSDSE